MEVKTYYNLEGCPDDCAHCKLDINETVYSNEWGFPVQVNLYVSCRHRDVCKFRESERLGDE